LRVNLGNSPAIGRESLAPGSGNLPRVQLVDGNHIHFGVGCRGNVTGRNAVIENGIVGADKSGVSHRPVINEWPLVVRQGVLAGVTIVEMAQRNESE